MTLEELRAKIKAEVKWVDIKPYSHNIIGLYLRQIDSKFGSKEAEKAITDFKLKDLGW